MSSINSRPAPLPILGKRKREVSLDAPSKRLKAEADDDRLVHTLRSGKVYMSTRTRPQKGKSPSSKLLSLPNDLLLEVFSHLDTANLGRVEQVNHRMNALAKGSYQPAYGLGPVHRSTPAFIPASDYRALAVEQLQFYREIRENLEPGERMPQWAPSDVMSEILDNYYATSDDSVHEVGTIALYMLQNSAQRDTPAWCEAVATALMAQGRHEEAATYYARLMVGGQTLPERTVLTAARFGGPLSEALIANATQPILEQAFIGAAVHGDVPMLQRLQAHGVALDVLTYHRTAATAAAQNGHVHVLQFLHDNQVDVLAHPVLMHHGTPLPQESALWEAAKHGQVAAAQFLLGLGGQPDQTGPGTMSSAPVDIATRLAEVDILRLFAQHAPGILGTHKADGALRLKDVVTGFRASTQKRIEALNFLVNEEGVDINATGHAGRTAIHEAAESGNVDLLAALVAAGANVHALDDAGQSAYEHTQGSEEHAAAATWLAAHMGVSTTGTVEQKLAHAKVILTAQRSLRLQQLVTGDFAYHFEGATVQEKSATAEAKWIAVGMEDKLSSIWARAYSAAALQGYVEKILGTPVEAISFRAALAAGAAAQLGSSEILLSDEAQVNEPLARKLATVMFPIGAGVDWALDKMAKAIANVISGDDLRTLEEYCDSDIGRMFAAGTKAKSSDEMMAMLDFVL